MPKYSLTELRARLVLFKMSVTWKSSIKQLEVLLQTIRYVRIRHEIKRLVLILSACVHSYVDLPGYSARMGTLFRDPQAEEPGMQTIPLTKIVCGPSESQLVMLQLE